MRTLEDLGYKIYRENFCPSIENDEYINENHKIIIFWKDGGVSCYIDDGEEPGRFTKDELFACFLKMA